MRKPSSSSWEQRLRALLSRPNVRDLYDGLRDLLDKLIADLEPLALIIAGSLARGAFVRGMSDIDMLVITGEPPDKRARFVLKNVRGVDVEITVFGLEEAISSAEMGNFFILDALKNGVVIYGRIPPELRALISG